MGPDEEVKDIVQDVFVIVYERLNQLDDPNAIKAWIASITVNVVRARLRWRRVRHSLKWVASKMLTGTPEASPEDSAILQGVYRVLAGMPDGQRIAWILRHVEQESVETVAKILGCSEATVKRWAGRAQQALTEEDSHD
jgi:RNA polymerase sigma-70 factor (ECF subfamily)